MCFPKPSMPKMDPTVKRSQQQAREREQERLAENKKTLLAKRNREESGGMRSLIGGSGSGFGSNFRS